METVSLRINVDRDSFYTIEKIRDFWGLKLDDKNSVDSKMGTVIKLLLFEQVCLNKKDKRGFIKKWDCRKMITDVKGIINDKLGEEFSIRFPIGLIEDIKKIKNELNYQGTDKEFMYEIILIGIKEIEHNVNMIKVNKKIIEQVHEYFLFEYKNYKKYDNIFSKMSKEVSVSKDDVYRWQLMKVALEYVNEGFHIVYEEI